MGGGGGPPPSRSAAASCDVPSGAGRARLVDDAADSLAPTPPPPTRSHMAAARSRSVPPAPPWPCRCCPQGSVGHVATVENIDAVEHVELSSGGIPPQGGVAGAHPLGGTPPASLAQRSASAMHLGPGMQMDASSSDASTIRGGQSEGTSGCGPRTGLPATQTRLHGTSHMSSSPPASTWMMATGLESGSSGFFLRETPLS